MISKELKAEIITAYQSGYTQKVIADRYGIARQTVARIVKSNAKTAKPPKHKSDFAMKTDSLTDATREQYIKIIKDRTLLSYVDFTDIVLRRVRYISALPQNSISNSDLTTLGNILKQLADVDFDDKQEQASVLSSLQLYLERLTKD